MRRLALACALGLLGCTNAPQGASTTVTFTRPRPVGVAGGTWVAKFDGDAITDAELSARFAEMNPYARARYQTVEQRKEYVEGLVRYELFAREAVKKGLAQDPEVLEATRRMMVQALLKKEVDQGGEVSAADVARYYQAHTSDYVKPAMTRLMHVFYAKAHKDKADAALAKVLALSSMDYASFQKLAREEDEDEKTKALEGDMRFQTDEELIARYGKPVAEAAASLKEVGAVVDHLVETDAGFHILKLQGRQAALNLSLEQARPSVVQVIQNERRQDRFKALLERLKKEAGLELNEQALAKIVVDPKAPAVEAKGPPPTTLGDPSAGVR